MKRQLDFLLSPVAHKIQFALAALICAILVPTSRAMADTYFIEPIFSSGSVKMQQASRFEQILTAEAKTILPGDLVKSRKLADTILKPMLLETKLGTKLVLERYDMGELLSVVEIPELDFRPADSWNRICARALRDVIYGNFQKPSKELTAELSRQRVGKSLPIAAQ